MSNDEIEALASLYSERGDEWVMVNAREDVPALAAEALSRPEFDEATAWVVLGAMSVAWGEGQDGLPVDHDLNEADLAEVALVRWVVQRFPATAENFSHIPLIEKCLKASKG